MDKRNIEKKSYGTILRSSSIIGGSQGFGYIIGLLRTKFVAILLGPSGVGLVGIYNSIITLTSTVSGMGLGNSGVREIAFARGASDEQRIGEVQLAILRIVLIMGVCMTLLVIMTAPFISKFYFQGSVRPELIGLLGLVILFRGLNVAQTTTLSGFRKIGKIAQIKIASSLSAAVVSILFYWWLGVDGILPSLIITAVLVVLFSWRAAKILKIKPKDSSWTKTLFHGKRLIALGASVAYGSFVATLVPLFARTMVANQEGVEAAGIYVAAWAISGLFAQFLLNAMSVDYLPRLSAVSDDVDRSSLMINEQTEMSVLLALVPVVALYFFAPWAIELLYTSAFYPAADLLPFLMLGVFFRLVNWSVGMIVLAKGEGLTYGILQSVSVLVHCTILFYFYNHYDLPGIAFGFALHNIIYTVFILNFVSIRYGIAISVEAKNVLLGALLVILMAALISALSLGQFVEVIIGFVLLSLVAAYAFYQISTRVSHVPAAQKIISRLPGFIKNRIN